MRPHHLRLSQAVEELLRLTVAFLLNSFAAASNNEVRWKCDSMGKSWKVTLSCHDQHIEDKQDKHVEDTFVLHDTVDDWDWQVPRYIHVYTHWVIGPSYPETDGLFSQDDDTRPTAGRLCRFCALFNHSCSSDQSQERRWKNHEESIGQLYESWGISVS